MKAKLIKMKNNNKGFSGVDIVIGMAIIVMFVPLISIMFVNIYMNWMTAKRNAMANAYATQIIEKAQVMYYDDVTEESLNTYINQELNIPSGYRKQITVENLNNNENYNLDLVKKITVSISYNIGKNEENITMETVKTKEILITPNTPKLEEGMVPVKYVENEQGNQELRTTSQNDSGWYNYENRRWAYAIKDEVIYEWIPRFAYVNNDIKFLYSNTDKYVENNNIIAEYTAHPAFGTKTGFWTEKTDEDIVLNDETDAIKKLSESKYGPTE